MKQSVVYNIYRKNYNSDNSGNKEMGVCLGVCLTKKQAERLVNALTETETLDILYYYVREKRFSESEIQVFERIAKELENK